MVNFDPEILNVQKLYYLKSALKGEAADLVRDCTINETNFSSDASATFCARYSNKRSIIKTHSRDLFGLSKLKNDFGLRKLLDDSGKSLRTLKALGEHVDN